MQPPSLRVSCLLQRIALAVSSAGLVLASYACADPQPGPTPAEIAEMADAYLQAQADAGFFSGAALIAHDGVPIFSKGYGYADLERRIPNTTTTPFRIASITKTFTATLVMRLHQRGTLDITRSVCEYVEPCPGTWQPVTLHHLLTHTSGIYNYTELTDFRARSRASQGPDRIVELFRDRPLAFAPGERYSYSNSNYFLLGQVLERVTDHGYEDLLKAELLEPIGMVNTGVKTPAGLTLAHGYVPDGMSFAHADDMDMAWVFAAGGMFSTVEDLLEWDQALRGERILPQSVLELMWTADKGPYGYGWQVLPPAPQTLNRRLLLHAGGLYGFATDLLRYPSERLTVIILANLETSPMAVISRDLSAIALGEPYSLPVVRRAIALDPHVYDDYVGEYEIGPEVMLQVMREDDRLIVQATGQPRDVAIPESESRFFSRRVDAQLSFTRDTNGRVTHATIHQGGRDIVAPVR